jgi:tRNA (guanine37-N1)-methyltransferase
MNFKIFTIFPEIFPGYLNYSIIGDALKKELWNFEAINIRDFATDNRKTVDDYPYGGGAGMVMKPDILASALDKNITKKKTKIIYLSPRGKVFNQQMAIDLAKEGEIALICGRYEGIDQRVIDEYEMEEISMGDYVLSGGELPAMTLIDAVLRNVEGVMGGNDSLKEESFGNGEDSVYEKLLEYPHYTKPVNWRGKEVPEILLSGHHKKISDWRLEKAQEITQERRKDLIQD